MWDNSTDTDVCSPALVVSNTTTVNVSKRQNVDKTNKSIKRKKKSVYKDLLKKDPRYSNEQKTFLLIKGSPHEATCRNCSSTITPGMLCFRIEGALVIDYVTDLVVEKNLYYHPNHCVTSGQPFWSNVKKPTSFEVSADVTDEQIQKTLENCNLVFKKRM